MESPTSLIQSVKNTINKARSKLFKEALTDIKSASIPSPIPSPTNKDIKPPNPNAKKIKAQEGAFEAFINSFTSTFLGFLLPVLIFFACTLAGSIAANDAINRSPLIRFVYFTYGSFPIFAPFVLIYYIVRYFMKTYPVWYNYLPLTTWHPENNILAFLMKPFVYTEDANIKYKFVKFLDAAKPMLLDPSLIDKVQYPSSEQSTSNAIPPNSPTNNKPSNAAPSNAAPSNAAPSNGTSTNSLTNPASTGPSNVPSNIPPTNSPSKVTPSVGENTA